MTEASKISHRLSHNFIRGTLILDGQPVTRAIQLVDLPEIEQAAMQTYFGGNARSVADLFELIPTDSGF